MVVNTNSKMSNVTQKLVNLLIPFSGNYSACFSATQISKKTGIPQQTASRGLNELAKNNLINYKTEGKNKMFYLDLEKTSSKNILNMIENHKALKFLVENKEVSLIIDEIIHKSKSLAVFGSYAKGTADRKSDLDAAIFGKKASIDDIKKRCVIEINEHYTSYSEFGRLLKNENPLAIEIAENHVFFGNVSELVDVLWRWNYGRRQR
ncbi:MAG: nucleotidyltransferase domain-containing protein [Candidatus Aenigmarchaeota archaeon]|nr:nucleotidyltransferase domain-containing protein [Candidatus Aenigmarchaeota archaeon]